MAQCHRRWFRAPARCRPEAYTLWTSFSGPSGVRGTEGPYFTNLLADPPGATNRRHVFRTPTPDCASTDLGRDGTHRRRAAPSSSQYRPRRSKPSPRFFAVGDARSRCASRSGAGVNAPTGLSASPRGAAFSQQLAKGRRSRAYAPSSVDGAWPSAQKLMAANSVRCPQVRGESVKGGLSPPFHKKVTTNRNSPPRAAGAQGSFDCRRAAPGASRGGRSY